MGEGGGDVVDDIKEGAIFTVYFVLFGGLRDEQATWQALLDQGILLRDVGLAHYLRVTAGTPQETEAFLGAMRRLAPTHRQEQSS